MATNSEKPTVMVTNDDGIDGPGLVALVHVLVSANRYNVLVCAPDTYVIIPSTHFKTLVLNLFID